MNSSARLQTLAELDRSGRTNLMADASYGAWLTPEVTTQTMSQLDARLIQHGISFENRALPLNPLPVLFRTTLWDALERRFAHLHRIIERVPALYERSAAARHFFRLPEMIDEFVQIECNVSPKAFFCRFDFSLDSHARPRIYELNAAAPAAQAWSPYFYEAMAALPVFQQVAADLGAKLGAFPNQRGGMLAKSLASLGTTRVPAGREISIGIINSRYNTMVNELDIIEREAQAIGVRTVRAFVEDLTYADGVLSADGQPIDLIFAKIDVTPGPDFLTPITRNPSDTKALRAAVANGLPYVNPFCSSFLIDNKSTLAFLQSPLAADILDAEDRALIDEIVPPTLALHMLTSAQLRDIRENRGKWVLKKSLDTRGRSVVIGNACTAEQWDLALAHAQADARDSYVIQSFEEPESCSVHGASLYFSHACFLLQGQPVGMITRTSRQLVTNVGSGGAAQVPLLVDLG